MRDRKLFISALLVLVLAVVLLVAPVGAQFRGGRGGRFGRGGPGGFFRGGPRSGLTGVLMRDEVQEELKLTDEQKESLRELAGQFRRPTPEMETLISRMREAPDEQREQIRQEMDKLREARRKELEAELQKILSPQQFERLQQISLRIRGLSALRDEQVAAELKLTQEQRDKINQIFQATDEQKRSLFERLREMPREDRLAALMEMRTKSQEIDRQRDAQILAVLTPEQRQLWEKKLGTPLPGEEEGPKPKSAPAVAATSPPGSTSPTQAASSTPAPSLERVGSVPAAPDGTEMSGPVVASFAPAKKSEGEASPAATKAPSLAEKPQAAPSTAKPASPTGEPTATERQPLQKLSFNFRFAPWTDVLKLFAEAAGLSLDLNAVPPGTFTYFDDNEYTPTEALDILNGYLLPKGYIIVRRDRFAVVLNIDNGIPPNLVPDVSVDELPHRANNELVRVVLPLKGKDAATAQEEVQQLLGPQGKAVAMTTTNTLVVTGLVRNVRRVHELLEKYLVEEQKDLQFRAFPLKHIAVTDAERILRDLLGLPKGVQNVSAAATMGQPGFMGRFGGRFPFGGAAFGSRFSSRFADRLRSRESSRPGPSRGPTPSATPSQPAANVSLAVDERTNTLLVSAPPTQMEIVEQAIQTIDVAQTGQGTQFATKRNEPYLEVYTTEHADASEVAKTLSVLYPGTVVNEDRRYGRIHIYATPSEQREIAALIRRLDGMTGGTTVAVIPTGLMDTATLTTTLQALFGSDPENSPSIVANPGQLVVRGTPEQVAQVRSLLEQMGAGAGAGRFGTGRVRTIPLGSRDPMQFLRLLQSVSPYPIRVRAVPGHGPIQDERVPAATSPVVPQVEPSSSPRRPDVSRPQRPTSRRNPGRFRRESYREEARPEPAPAGPAGSAAGPRSDASQGGPESSPAADRPTAARGSIRSHPLRVIFASQQQEEPAQHETRAQATPDKPRRQPEAAKGLSARPQPEPAAAAPSPTSAPPDAAKPRADAEAQPKERPPTDSGPQQGTANRAPEERPEIVVEVQGNNLVISSADEKALDQLEQWIYMLAQQIPEQTGWTVFYLRSADATEAAAMLEQLFPDSTVATASSSSGLIGSLSRFGSSVMQSTGLSNVASTETLQIIPETRLNALFVSGPPDKVRDVENVLKVLDASELPEQLRDRAPRTIPVEYADATQVAEIIRSVYAVEMGQTQQSSARGGTPPGGPLAAFLGRGGSRGGSRAAEQVKLTLGVDTSTNQIIVSCNDSLYRQIEALVKELDQAAYEARQTVRVVTVQHANAEAVQQALTSMIPKLSITTSTGTSSVSSSRTSRPGTPPPRVGGGPSPDQIRAFFLQRLRERMSQGGRSPFSRGSSGFRPPSRSSSRGSSRFRPPSPFGVRPPTRRGR